MKIQHLHCTYNTKWYEIQILDSQLNFDPLIPLIMLIFGEVADISFW